MAIDIEALRTEAIRELIAWRYFGDISLKRTLPKMSSEHKAVFATAARIAVNSSVVAAAKACSTHIVSDPNYQPLLACSSAESRRWEGQISTRSIDPSWPRGAIQEGYELGVSSLRYQIEDFGYEPDEILPHLQSLYFPPADHEPGTLWLPPVLEG